MFSVSFPTIQIAEVKVKGGGSPSGEMEEDRRICKNCKRDVAAVNFSLHEAHCMRFLALCPKCEELVASKDMKEHYAKAHQKVRCILCHKKMQQYLLEYHEAEECQERLIKCHFCELELPFHMLQPHLDACGSRTTMCWDCGKYVMHKAQEEHKLICQTDNMLRSPGSKTNLCQQCNNWFPADQYLLHLNECSSLPQLLGALATHSAARSRSPPSPWSPPSPSPSSPTWKMKAEKDVRPKRRDRELPSLQKASLRSPRSKKASSCQDFASILTSTGPQALNDAYDQLATCSQCNIFLPSPVLQKHEKKCQRAAALQAIRQSSRFLEKEGESMQSSPEGSSWQ
ncbi:XIAP-associated factor 1 isoform X2 [Crotalus tigris]|uniref:XIAP-associated factor 1 isoform X2 n=2 Tax=Crotalus tigris TaxID=88082 RepID=UPI00192F81C1|nr:XIAP-associated factor 1 isoform X2 [Crotalus tigris]XP_039202116.1 XIAP-associated factor 1 isoform X2 [Crotalus tigris]